jgi:hypothetical protein
MQLLHTFSPIRLHAFHLSEKSIFFNTALDFLPKLHTAPLDKIVEGCIAVHNRYDIYNFNVHPLLLSDVQQG